MDEAYLDVARDTRRVTPEPPNHLFVGSYGHLRDTRVEHWESKPPLRRRYKCIYGRIENTAQLKATLRHGKYAWPGGYPLYFITSDGCALSFETVRAELRNVIDSIKRKINDGWRVIGCDVNWEDADLVDDHTGNPIESAYGDDDD